MIHIYKKILSEAITIDNKSERLTYLTSVLRSILHVGVIATFEITKRYTPDDESDMSELADRFRKPADGLPVQILDNLIPFVRSYYDRQFLNGWFEKTKTNNVELSKSLLKWVEFRNKRPGHGVLDIALIEEWAEKTLEIINDTLNVFSNIIPEISDDGTLTLTKISSSPKINFPLIHQGCAIVIMDISVRLGSWKLKGQLLSRTAADEFSLPLADDNVFSRKSLRSSSEYALSEFMSKNKFHSLFHNIPVRQTEIFEGRIEELKSLNEWLDDKDSRFCLVYGDGGFGKTTLVLELLNQIMESKIDLEEPIPSLISYHSAKMTKWTEEGLVHFTSIEPIMDDSLRELMRCFFPVLPAEWYGISGRVLIDKVVSVLKTNKFNRDDVLLVIDNTETLATSSHEVTELGKFFKQVGKLVGRIIITSRRREFIEATPIIVNGLSELECVNLMKRLAVEYSATPIIQASEGRLRRVSNQLMRKPILLEVLVKYISHSKTGIDEAIEKVFRKSNEELLEFLYEDAWLRMSHLQQEVFMVIINMASPIEKNTITKACQEIGIQHMEFQSGLEETHFAILIDNGKSYSIELVELAKRFFLQKFGRLEQQRKDEIKAIASSVDSYATERAKVEKEYRTDRVAEAFRNEYAKAAKVHADRNEIIDAIEMYKLAIEEDPLNSALHSRFAWLLLNKTQEFLYAKEISLKAVELDKNNCDSLVVLALSCYRLGDIESGDFWIGKSTTKGRTQAFCLLRKAIARYHKARNEADINSQIALLEQAEEMLSQANTLNTRNGGYDRKTGEEIDKYNGLTRIRLATSRTKRTKSLQSN